MLILSIAHNQPVVIPPFPDMPSSETEVWYENSGAVCAYGRIVDGRHWMLLPGVASFCFDGNTAEVKAFPYPLVEEHVVRDVYLRCVLPIALQVRGWEVLHASAVRHPRGVVVLCAVSETGKSTIAYGLSRRGYPLWADDAVAFEAAASESRAVPLPFRIHLRSPSASYFSVDQTPQPVPIEQQATEKMPGEPALLAAIFVLKRVDDDPAPDTSVKISRLTSNDAFPALLTHAYCFGLKDIERKRRMLQNYLDVAMHVPIFELHFPAGLERLPNIIDTVAQAVLATDPHRHEE